jgi:G3E family GTPase
MTDHHEACDHRTGDNRIGAGAGPAAVATVCSLTDELRMSAAGSVLLDCRDGIQLTFDLAVDKGLIRRRAHDLSGMVEDVRVPMEQSCVCCSLRAEVVRSVRRWSSSRREIVVVLPPTTEPGEIVAGLAEASDEMPAAFRVCGVVTAVDAVSLEHDVFGDDLLDERGLAQGDHDRRAVGEVLCHQLEYSDVITLSAPATSRTDAVLDHLGRPDSTRVEVHELTGAELLAGPVDVTERPLVGVCGAPGQHVVERSGRAVDRDGVWTIELRSDRPFAPDRLRAEIARLGAGRVRGRGQFWLPTRPGLRCVWDGAGGQLSIGPAGAWRHERAETWLVITGTDGDPQRLREAFDQVLLTDAEYVAGPEHWSQIDDGLDPWLGRRTF